MKGPVYLAGPITGLSHKAADDWRIDVAAKLKSYGIGTIDPLRGMRYKGRATSDAAHHPTLEGHPFLSPGHLITRRDAYGVRIATCLFVNLVGAKKISVGTMLEIGMAFALNKYILLVMEPEGNIHEHAMVLDMASTVCPDLESAIETTAILMGGLE